MGTSVLLAVLVAANGVGALLPSSEIKKQNEIFQRHWGTDFVWKFEDLPDKAVVPGQRVPYAGYIYPDRAGGTSSALIKYDAAFNRGRPATAYEQWDTTAFQEKIKERGFLGIQVRRMGTPHWYGHCNGWAAAAIRHAEPQETVVRNGVSFTPANIKALLAEIYIYNDTEDLVGPEGMVNPAVLHTVVTNWIGRGGHSLGIESDPGEEKWNYPVYGYSTASAKRSTREVEVKMNVAYQKDTKSEYQEAPDNQRIKYFHYNLTLDSQGYIIGGRYYGDSADLDMLWVPLRPKASRQKGNERGNPHVDVDRVVSIWRDSVPKEQREKWLVIDPHPADRVLNVAQTDRLVPIQDPNAPKIVPPAFAEREQIVETTSPTPVTSTPETVTAETSTPETAASETPTIAESTPPETTTLDAATLDATTVDATTVDATTVDATTVDATTVDVSNSDWTPADSNRAADEMSTADEIGSEPAITDATDSDDAASDTEETPVNVPETDTLEMGDSEAGEADSVPVADAESEPVDRTAAAEEEIRD